MKRAVGDLLVRCELSEEGCAWSGELRDLVKHMEKCLHRQQQQQAELATAATQKRICDLRKEIVEKDEKIAVKDRKIVEKDEEIAGLKIIIHRMKHQMDILQKQVDELQNQSDENNSQYSSVNPFVHYSSVNPFVQYSSVNPFVQYSSVNPVTQCISTSPLGRFHGNVNQALFLKMFSHDPKCLKPQNIGLWA